MPAPALKQRNRRSGHRLWGLVCPLILALGLLPCPSAPALGAQPSSEPSATEPEKCPHAKGWRPTQEELASIRAKHRAWMGQFDPGAPRTRTAVERAVLCNADLRGANLLGGELSGADLRGANLSGANLTGANLSGASLTSANLRDALLSSADLRDADLSGARLIGAAMINTNLSGAELRMALLNRADLRLANLSLAELSKANLSSASLTDADLGHADLTDADLRGAVMPRANLSAARLLRANLRDAELPDVNLSSANLVDANLSRADLSRANLTEAMLVDTDVTDARLGAVDLTAAVYAPVSLPPAPDFAGLKGLKSVRFQPGREPGLVLLRNLLKETGLRDLEREATFALEHGRTVHALRSWRTNPARAVEGAVRLVAFEWTTGYGLHPERALLLIGACWVLLIPLYLLLIASAHTPPAPRSAIYRLRPKERIIDSEGTATQAGENLVERLHARGRTAIGYAAYFSLLSTFRIGFREFNVGTWIGRLQARPYALIAMGWARVVSGLQSLLSVYLLAMWALTYFGRPFA